jgi:hypothetical protein
MAPVKEPAMSERKFDMNRDGLGLLLFALGLFPSVLIVKAMQSSTPLDHVSGDGPLAATWIAAIGALPSLVFTATVALLGGRLFLTGRRDGIGRIALGMALTSVGLAVLLGAFSPTAGGNVGYATGGLVTSMSHVAVGALFGLVALALPIWFTWLRKERAPRIAADPESAGGGRPEEEVDDGVSAEEAAALVPDDFGRAIEEGRKQLATRPSRSASPTSPYPEDVRLKGEIPAGARPLERALDAETQSESASQPSSVYRWTAARAGEPALGAGADLAVEREAEHVFEAQPIGERDPQLGDAELDTPELDDADIGGELDGTEAEAHAPPLELIDEQDGMLTAPAPEAGAPPAEPLTELPRPSWEQPSMFEDGEEPVDAYGTPRTLVDALRRDREERVADDEHIELDHDEEFADELEEVAAHDDGELSEVAELDDERSGAIEIDAEDASTDDELEDEVDEELGEEEPAEEGDELADEEEVVATAEATTREPEPRSVPSKSGSRSRPLDSGPEGDGPLVELMDQSRTSAKPAAAPAASELAVGARSTEPSGERELVLQPRPVSREKAIKPQPVLGERTQLLRDAGCLFVDRGRVAVSMLQRQYGMDFDEACKVLDELQDLGLIGPYLGGQHRDILLTRDQWLEKVGGA